MMDRRSFIGSAAMLAAAGCVRPSSPGMTRAFASTGGRLPIGFSTLGCPTWDWLQALDFAAAHGYSGIELRGIKDTMDLPKTAEFQPERLAQTQRELKDRGLVITDLGASTNL